MNILIVGGIGAFGSIYAKLLKKNKFNIFIKDIDKEQTKFFCEEKGFNNFEENYKEIDIIIISVPNSVAPIVVSEISKNAFKKTLICDFCSVKSNIVKELEKLKDKDFELASIHPMHGPRISSIKAYPVVTIEIKTGKNYEKLINFFKTEKVNLIKSTAQEHDKILSIVQGLTHYTQIVSAQTIKESNIDMKKLCMFASPNFDLFVTLISRVLLQNPTLYSQIQIQNPFNTEMRKLFLENVTILNKLADKNESKEIEKLMVKASDIFDYSNNILIQSDLAISALKFIENSLKENIGKLFLVENITTQKFHYGIIKEVNHQELKIDEGKITTTIALNKIRLTTKKEMQQWKTNNILEKYLDYSFFIPKQTNKDFIVKLFNSLKIAKFECIDEFTNKNFPNNKKSITLRATFFVNENKENINKEILETLFELGFEKR